MRNQNCTTRKSFLSLLRFCGLVFLLLCSVSARAQDATTPQRGFLPAGSYALTDLETISTSNGNMVLSIPMAALPSGRGNSPGAGVGLVYNSKLYDTQTSFERDYASGEWVALSLLTASQEGGWRYGFQYELELENRRDQGPGPSFLSCDPASASYEAYNIFKLKMSFPDGSVHVFQPLGYTDFTGDGFFQIRPDGWVQTCSPPNYGYWTYNRVTYFSVDGTFLRLDIEHDDLTGAWQDNPWTLYFGDGRRVTNNEAGTLGQRIYDRNNNFTEVRSITYNGHPSHQIIDQLNRSIIIEYGSNYTDYIRVTGVGGVQVIWTVRWISTYALKSYYPSDNTTVRLDLP